MDTSFGLQDKLYNLFINDATLLSLVDNPTGDEQLNNKFRREDAMPELLDKSDLDFIAFFFINSQQTRNAKANEGILEINFYTSFRYNAKRLVERVRELIDNEYPEWGLIAEGQKPSGIIGVYKYRLRFDPLIAG